MVGPPPDGEEAVFRGGGWDTRSDYLGNVATGRYEREGRDNRLGFRPYRNFRQPVATQA